MLVTMTRALLVIDVQESFRQRPLWAAISNPGIAGDVARLVDGARASGDLVAWVLHSEPGSGTPFDPASGYYAVLLTNDVHFGRNRGTIRGVREAVHDRWAPPER